MKTDLLGLAAEKSVTDVARFVVGRINKLIALTVVCGALGALLSVVVPPQYEAEASFYSQSATDVSGLEAAAAQFGLSLGSSLGGQSPDFYVKLLANRHTLELIALSPVAPGERGFVFTDSVALYPVAAGSVARYLDEDAADDTALLESSVRELRKRLAAVTDRETGIVTISFADEDPAVALHVAGAALALIGDFDEYVRRSQARLEREFAGEQLSLARAELERTETATADFLERNRDISQSPQLQFELERLRREVSIRLQVVTTLTEAFERAKLDEVRDTPVMTVVGPPRVWLTASPPRWVVWTAAASVLGFVFTIAGLSLAALVWEAIPGHWRLRQFLSI